MAPHTVVAIHLHFTAVIFPLMKIEMEMEMEMIFLQKWKVRMEIN